MAIRRDTIEEFKKYLTRFPPPTMHHDMCIQRGPCGEAYAAQWWMRVGQELLDPSVPISVIAVPSFVQGVMFSGMMDGCLRRTMDAVSETLIVNVEIDIVERVLAKLLIVEGFESV
jgi:hypothetical protein